MLVFAVFIAADSLQRLRHNPLDSLFIAEYNYQPSEPLPYLRIE